MVHDGSKRSSNDNSFLKPGTSHQNLSLPQYQAVQRSEAGKNFTEMEGRGYSDFYRNTSEELFIKTLMEGSVGMPAPTMEMLGFKNLSQNFHTDSEELFKSWLTTGETQGYNSASIAHRTRQASRRISAELASLLFNQQNGVLQKRSNENPNPQNTTVAEEFSNDINQQSVRHGAERGVPASNLYLAKAWFHSSQPMTRSRSSELRKRYAAIQNSQTAFVMEEAMHNASGHGVNNMKQEFGNPNGFIDASICEIPNQFTLFMSPSNSSSSNFNTPQMGTVDNISSVVSMLKGSLERKKLTNQIEKEAVEDSSLGYYGAQEGVGNPSLNQGQDYHICEAQGTFQDLSAPQVNRGVLQTAEGSIHIGLEEFVAPTNPIQMSTVSREPSHSESSAAAPVVSAGFDACDGPSKSGQTQSNCENSRQQVGKGKSSENGSRAKDIRDQMYDNLKEDRQKGSLVRYGSVTSSGSVDRGDPTKKRRVERSRKMAEAKERVLTPAISSDMQSILKRCENLEKEVRSLKLNLAFMNRKDSEQTKQIEELQKQNEELTDEKERLLEEIERIISETGKM